MLVYEPIHSYQPDSSILNLKLFSFFFVLIFEPNNEIIKNPLLYKHK